MDKSKSMSVAEKSKAAEYEKRWRDGSESYPTLIDAIIKKTCKLYSQSIAQKNDAVDAAGSL